MARITLVRSSDFKICGAIFRLIIPNVMNASFQTTLLPTLGAACFPGSVCGVLGPGVGFTAVCGLGSDFAA